MRTIVQEQTFGGPLIQPQRGCRINASHLWSGVSMKTELSGFHENYWRLGKMKALRAVLGPAASWVSIIELCLHVIQKDGCGSLWLEKHCSAFLENQEVLQFLAAVWTPGTQIISDCHSILTLRFGVSPMINLIYVSIYSARGVGDFSPAMMYHALHDVSCVGSTVSYLQNPSYN